jgi:hypothetical protein
VFEPICLVARWHRRYILMKKIFTQKTKTMYVLRYLRSYSYVDYFSIFTYTIAGTSHKPCAHAHACATTRATTGVRAVLAAAASSAAAAASAAAAVNAALTSIAANAGMFVVFARALMLPVVAMVSIWRLDRAMVSEQWESRDPGYVCESAPCTSCGV